MHRKTKYDEFGNIVGYVDNDGNHLDTYGNITGKTDRNGLHLDTYGNITGKTDRNGLHLDTYGNITGKTDRNGLHLDKYGNITGRTEQNDYHYDSFHESETARGSSNSSRTSGNRRERRHYKSSYGHNEEMTPAGILGCLIMLPIALFVPAGCVNCLLGTSDDAQVQIVDTSKLPTKKKFVFPKKHKRHKKSRRVRLKRSCSIWGFDEDGHSSKIGRGRSGQSYRFIARDKKTTQVELSNKVRAWIPNSCFKR